MICIISKVTNWKETNHSQLAIELSYGNVISEVLKTQNTLLGFLWWYACECLCVTVVPMGAGAFAYWLGKN